ncbi:MAG: BBE domain-containing protein [Edaphobacter sp.]
MSIQTITRQDSRFSTLIKSRNARWPGSASDPGAASRIELCDTPKDVEEAVQRAIDAKLRPTVRSGGHCYEDFVANNPGGVILDVSLLSDAIALPNNGGYRIGTGTQMGQAYWDLYRRHNVTLPGASCGSVGAGGHITGGGYGVLSRLQGITVDWLSAVDIVTVDAKGKAQLRKVDAKHDADLFRAVRGAGGNNFGVITNYYFDKLPAAPTEVMSANISFSWDGMTQEKFEKILSTYGHYHETRGKDPETWGLFTIIVLTHKARGRFNINLQFCNPDGTCKDTKVLDEFLELFSTCNPSMSVNGPMAPPDERYGSGLQLASYYQEAAPKGCGVPVASHHNWIDATARGMTIQRATRAKYKSTYMKKNFSQAEIAVYYKHLTAPMKGPDISCIVAVDSFGGLTNRPELVEETAVAARESIMKLQFQQYWQNPAEDEARVEWFRNFYTDLYSTVDCDQDHKGTPYWNDRYEGCYINYPDADMTQYPYWMELYYGTKGLVPFLQQVKKKYDPNNIFHHAMSIRT